jgi:hypothetical protein
MQSIRRIINIFALVALLACGVVAQDPSPAAREYSRNTWKEFTSKEGRFSVLFPGTPTKNDRNLDTPAGPVATHGFMVQSDVSAYYLSYSEFPKASVLTPQDQREMLDSSRNHVITDGAKLISEADISVAGTLGRELLAEKNGMILRARFAYVNGRLYNLIIGVQANTAFTTGKPSANAADRTELFEEISTKFFNSFKLTK